MLPAMIIITVISHLFVPPYLSFWMYKTKTPNKLTWVSIAALAGGYNLLMWQAGAAWSWFGFYWPTLFLIFYFVMLPFAYRKKKDLPWIATKDWRSLTPVSVIIALAILFLVGVPSTFMARQFPKDKSIALQFPLKNGTYHIGHGGSNEAMNHHYLIPAQRFALDIVKLNSKMIRADGALPKDLNKYAIFGEELFAPCKGEVIGAQTDLADQTPPVGDKNNIIGNHIILFCDGVSVMLAHLQQNSVKVKVGDLIEAGQSIAAVGNTGNTSEPHLHIQAVLGRTTEANDLIVNAIGVPMTFDGSFLIRNDRITQN